MNMKPTPAKTRESREGVPDVLKLAHQIHTLVQILTTRLAAPTTTMVPAQYPPFLH
jgi:hypothetical protein